MRCTSIESRKLCARELARALGGADVDVRLQLHRPRGDAAVEQVVHQGRRHEHLVRLDADHAREGVHVALVR